MVIAYIGNRAKRPGLVLVLLSCLVFSLASAKTDSTGSAGKKRSSRPKPTDLPCGDGVLDAGEQCDGNVFQAGISNCTDLGHDYGILECTADCTFSSAYCHDVSPNPPAQPDNTWVDVGLGSADATFVEDNGALATGHPNGRAWFPITFDKAARRILVFGGGVAGSCGSGYVNDVWELWYTGSAWEWNQRQPVNRYGGSSAPWMQGTDNHGAYYDADNDVHWIVGGTCQSSTASRGWGYYDYTSNAFVEGTMGVNANAPPDANFFDPAFAWGNWGEPGHGGAWSGVWVSAGEWNQSSNRTSLFDTSTGNLTSDNWLPGVAKPTLTDSVRKQIEEMGVYIPSTKKFMFFGGRGNPSSAMRDDTYEYDPINNSWEHVCGATIGIPCGPASRMKSVMAYNSRHDIVLLQGGEGTAGGSSISDTWIYDPQDQQWSQLLAESAGPGLWLHGGAYDSYNDVFVLWGGQQEGVGKNKKIYTLRYQPGQSDTTPPTTPTNVGAAALSDTAISISWQQSSDAESGVSRYRVYRDGSLIGEPPGTSHNDSNLGEATNYSYEVSAVNGAGLESTRSDAASATTFADTIAPTVVSANSVGDPTRVSVEFSEPVDGPSATTSTNYTVDNGIVVTSASLGSDLRTVTLSTSAHAGGVTYTLTVNGVRDRANNPNTIAPNSSVSYSYTSALIISGITVSSGRTYVVADSLIDGSTAYVDRAYVYASIPSYLAGAKHIQTANDDKLSSGDVFLTFDVNQAATVYVAHDDGYAAKPQWLGQLTDSGDGLTISSTVETPFSLFRKDFPAGSVVLGGNVSPGESQDHSMYVVIVVPATVPDVPPAPPLGLAAR